MGIDCLHRVEVLKVPGQVVLGRERGRSQLAVVLILGVGGIIHIGIVVVIVVLQRQSVAVWT